MKVALSVAITVWVGAGGGAASASYVPAWWAGWLVAGGVLALATGVYVIHHHRGAHP